MTNAKKTWEKQFMKPKNFRDCGGPWRLWHLGFFTNHLIWSLWEIENLDIGNNLNFISNIHTLQRGLTPYFMKKNICCCYPPFKICPNLPTPHSTPCIFLLSYFFGWIYDRATSKVSVYCRTALVEPLCLMQ